MGTGHRLRFGACGLMALCTACLGEDGVDFEPSSDEIAVVEDAPAEPPAPRPIHWLPPEGPIDEAAACSAIVDTYRFHGLDIGCPTTVKACPDLFRDAFGVACMQYDAASVDACLSAITDADSCDALYALDCDIAPVWGTEPSGC